MKLRRFVLTTCIMLLTTLFGCGVAVLYYMDTSAGEKREEHREPARPETVISEEPQNPEAQTERREEPRRAEVKKPVNMVIFGLDDEEVRSDVIVVLNFDPESGNINILSIARDTRVRVNGGNAKINAMIGKGKERLAIQKVEEITGLKMNYYLTMNFKGFRKIVDVLDGVEMEVPINMDYDDPDQNLHIHLRKGRQVLNGKKAEQFVRYRKGNNPGQGYSDGDIGRIKMQQEFIRALIEQKFKLRYLSKADDIYFILKKYVRTNIEFRDIEYHIKSVMNVKNNTINTFTPPGESAYIDDVWYFICDRKKTRQLIEENFYR